MSIGEKRLEESPLREWMLQDTVYMEFEDIKKLIFRVEREKQNFSSRILSFRSSILFTSNKRSLRSERFQLSIREYNLLVFFFFFINIISIDQRLKSGTIRVTFPISI